MISWTVRHVGICRHRHVFAIDSRFLGHTRLQHVLFVTHLSQLVSCIISHIIYPNRDHPSPLSLSIVIYVPPYIRV